MLQVVRRIAIAFGSFVIAWLAVGLLAIWFFGSGNILVWAITVVVSIIAYFVITQRDRRSH